MLNKMNDSSRIAHEMNNILTLLNASIELIKRDHPEVAGFKYWDTVEGDLAELTKLAICLSAAHKEEVLYDCNDITALVYEMRDIFTNVFKDKNVQLVINVDEGERVNSDGISLPVRKGFTGCYFNYSQIKLSLINLIKNAYEACFCDTAINLSLGRYSKGERQYTMIKVSNHGETLCEHELSLLFEENYTTKSKGTGKGLSFVKKAVSENSGFVTVNSKEGLTEFTIFLPDR